jgi:hypothetical protein
MHVLQHDSTQADDSSSEASSLAGQAEDEIGSRSVRETPPLNKP